MIVPRGDFVINGWRLELRKWQQAVAAASNWVAFLFNTARRSDRDEDWLCLLLAGLPWGRLIMNWSSIGWGSVDSSPVPMLVAVDIQAIFLFFCLLHFPSPLSSFLFFSYSWNLHLFLTLNVYCWPIFLTHICLFLALWVSFLLLFIFFLAGFKCEVFSMEMGVCVLCVWHCVCVCVCVHVKTSVCICARESIPIISDLLANWKIPSILPSRHP